MTTTDAVERALTNNDFDTAFDLLEAAADAARDSRRRARVELQLAAVYALYGRDGTEGGEDCLREALRLDGNLATDPLQQALSAVFTAFALEAQADPAADAAPRRERAVTAARAALSGQPEARFHAAVALIALGEPEPALTALEGINVGELPRYLAWRYWSWRGGALEDLGRYREAANAYGQGAQAAPDGQDKAGLLLDKAAMLLELDEAHEAFAPLEEARTAHPLGEAPIDEAARLTLEARAHLALNNPGLAAERAERARRLELAAGEPSYGTALVQGQALATNEQWEPAIAAFREAVSLALPPDRAYALHELGLTQMDAGSLLEAHATLSEAARDREYPHLGEVYADIAEVEYRLGNYDEAEAAARRALELGAVVPASMLLGNIAAEYFRPAEAVVHYQRVIEGAPEGSRDWVIAHEMVADTLAQDGFRDPRGILEHSQLALPHLDASDEWALTLQAYITRATGILQGGATRTDLN